MHDWHAIGLAMVVLFGVLPGLLGAAVAGGRALGAWRLRGRGRRRRPLGDCQFRLLNHGSLIPPTLAEGSRRDLGGYPDPHPSF